MKINVIILCFQHGCPTPGWGPVQRWKHQVTYIPRGLICCNDGRVSRGGRCHATQTREGRQMR